MYEYGRSRLRGETCFEFKFKLDRGSYTPENKTHQARSVTSRPDIMILHVAQGSRIYVDESSLIRQRTFLDKCIRTVLGSNMQEVKFSLDLLLSPRTSESCRIAI